MSEGRNSPFRPARRRVPSAREARASLRTVRDLLRYAVTRFGAAGLAYGQGTQDAYDEAAWLVLWSLHLPHDTLEPFLDARLTPAEVRDALDLIERRCVERVPAAYLTGEAWLRGMRFRADPRALVPRSPIAEALDEALPDWLSQRDLPEGWPSSVLDLCTGGGSLAIFAATRFPDAAVAGSDLSADALALAAENVADHGLQERVELVRGDLFEGLAGRRFDLILCNPPYVNSDSMSRLPPEFLAEPRGALAGGDDGMDFVRRLLAEAADHLSDEGLLLLEIGHEAEHFEAAFPALEFAWLPVAAGERMLALIERAQLAPRGPAKRRRAAR